MIGKCGREGESLEKWRLCGVREEKCERIVNPGQGNYASVAYDDARKLILNVERFWLG